MVKLKRTIKHWLVNGLHPLIVPLVRVTALALAKWDAAEATDIFYKHGWHLLRRDYYLPIPEKSDLPDSFWEQRSELVGLDMNEHAALDILDNVCAPYMGEFRDLVPTRPSLGHREQLYLINGRFMAIDAHIYYSLIRHFQPTHIIEIGAGASTRIAGLAVQQNLHQYGAAPRLTAIDPFPDPALRKGFPGLSELISKRLQDVDMTLFTSLKAGDILFVDSTHVLRAGGDVVMAYCEILPRLAPGVLVHVHDISLPKPYPKVYFDSGLYWNEQYVLQAFLSFNSRFEVIWPGNYMLLNYRERVCNVIPEYHAMREEYPSSEPTSFWMRVIT